MPVALHPSLAYHASPDLPGGLAMDTGKVVRALLEAPGSLCEDCLAQRAGLALADFVAAIERLQRQLKLALRRSRCAGCSRFAETLRIA